MNFNGSGTSTPTGYSTPPVLEPVQPIASGSNSNGNRTGNSSASGSNSNLTNLTEGASRRPRFYAGESNEHEEEEEDTEISTEIDVVIDIPLPVWTTPTHTVHPVFVNHKIKWSAFIK